MPAGDFHPVSFPPSLFSKSWSSRSGDLRFHPSLNARYIDEKTGLVKGKPHSEIRGRRVTLLSLSWSEEQGESITGLWGPTATPRAQVVTGRIAKESHDSLSLSLLWPSKGTTIYVPACTLSPILIILPIKDRVSPEHLWSMQFAPVLERRTERALFRK